MRRIIRFKFLFSLRSFRLCATTDAIVLSHAIYHVQFMQPHGDIPLEITHQVQQPKILSNARRQINKFGVFHLVHSSPLQPNRVDLV